MKTKGSGTKGTRVKEEVKKEMVINNQNDKHPPGNPEVDKMVLTWFLIAF